MKMSKTFVIRLALWSILMLYLLCDLVLFTGPLRTSIRKLQGFPDEKIASDIERGVIARVFDKPILLSQVDYRVDEILWRSGRDRTQVPLTERIALRTTALYDIIDNYIFREKVMLNQKDYPVTEQEIQTALKRFASRFTNKAELFKALEQQGFDGEKELSYRLAARIQQNKYLKDKIAPGTQVTDQETLDWYNAHKKELTTPARRKARHIFLAALQNTQEQATQKLQPALQKITAKTSTFQSEAKTLSEDQRTKNNGGDLGWFTQNRLPEDFTIPTFDLPLNTPTIIRTKLGWHLIEITAELPPTLKPYQAAKPEIHAALQAPRQKAAVEQYRRNLRLQHPNHIKIHKPLLKSPWTN